MAVVMVLLLMLFFYLMASSLFSCHCYKIHNVMSFSWPGMAPGNSRTTSDSTPYRSNNNIQRNRFRWMPESTKQKLDKKNGQAQSENKHRNGSKNVECYSHSFSLEWSENVCHRKNVLVIVFCCVGCLLLLLWYRLNGTMNRTWPWR